MPDNDNKDPNYNLLLEKITNLENKIAEKDNVISELQTKIDKVTDFNRALLNQPAGKPDKKDVAKSATDKLNKFLDE